MSDENTQALDVNKLKVIEILSEGEYTLGLVEDDDRSDYSTPYMYAVVHTGFGVVEAKGTVLSQMWAFYDECLDSWDEFKKAYSDKPTLTVVGDDDGPVRH